MFLFYLVFYRFNVKIFFFQNHDKISQIGWNRKVKLDIVKWKNAIQMFLKEFETKPFNVNRMALHLLNPNGHFL